MRRWSLSRCPKLFTITVIVRLAPREDERNQHQDWRLVFVDRPETEQITDCLDDVMFDENIGFDRDTLSRSICASVGGCYEVCLRKVQTGPELGMASLAQRIAEEEVSSTKGGKRSSEGVNFDVLIFARCRMGFDRYAM